MSVTNSQSLNPYIDAGWQLIPLHSYNYFDEHHGKKRDRGKSPLHSNWTKRPYRSQDQLAHMDAGNNVGVRLRAQDLVIDVDPRNFEDGDDPFKRLCQDCDLDPEDYPTVHTGSGGMHVYMGKPADVSIRDSLQDYQGVEFKTLGRQVVSAGSVHPLTKKNYEWDMFGPELKDAKEAPTVLINIIRRPSSVQATGGGEYSQEQLAEMLDALDPEDFQNHDDWFTLMQACHHATAGDGRSEFIEWSTRDPVYQDDGGLIGRRWDSLHADSKEGESRVTYRTLLKVLRDSGNDEVIPRRLAQDDFDAVGPEDFDEEVYLEEHERKGPLERMNDRYWAVMEGGQFKIYWEEIDPEFDARKRWIKAKPFDFKSMLANKNVQRGDKVVPIADAWLRWPGRRSARGVIFDPEHDHEGFLNLWVGWGVDPRKNGTWERLNELLYEVLCDGDEYVYEYVLNWAAYMAQHPGQPGEVAVCFQGGKGVGKGTWGRVLAHIAGKHGMHITSSDHLTGRFNDHLRNVILLFADEAVRPYDKVAENRLKGLITEPSLSFEGKGKDVASGRNRLHIVMASNEDWFVPVGLDGERRFLLQLANTKKQGKHSWFEKLHQEMNNGGYEALLWDLLHRNIDKWAPRKDIPCTEAYVEQKIRNMSPIEQWWFNILSEGELPFQSTDKKDDWFFDSFVRVFKDDVRDSFEEHCRDNGIRFSGAMGRSIDMTFSADLRKLIPGLRTRTKAFVPDDRPDLKMHSDGRAWTFDIPCLSVCRSAMDAMLGSKIKWEAEN